jgi:hypothetical protein
MKKNLLKTALFISIVIGMIYTSCKPSDFTEEDAMSLQAKLEKQKLLLQDSLDKANILLLDSLERNKEKVTYTIGIIDASKSTLLKTAEFTSDGVKGGLTGVSITVTQGSIVTTKTTAANGLVTFDNLKKGLATLHIVLTGYSEINAVVDFAYFGINTQVNGGFQFGNVLPMLPLSGSTTGTIKGTVVCESDLTNKVPEPVPTGTKVIATINTGSAGLSGIMGGIIVSISYDNLSLEALTDATGAFTMTVPGTSTGLDYSIRVSDFSVNQTLLMLTKAGLPVTGAQSVLTTFGSNYSSGSSSIPTVSAATVTIGAPDYTFTAATATATVANVNGLDYIQMTYPGNYYLSNYTFTNVPVDNPVPGTGGSNAYMTVSTNSFGQVTSATITTDGSGYAASAEGATFTMPYIRQAAKATVLAVNASGGITSWRVTTTGQFYSTGNIDFFRSLGVGTGATLTLPTIFSNGTYLYFTTAVQTPSSPLGSGYVVNDEFTLAVKSGLSDNMLGKFHMTTGSVTTISVTSDGTNYISGGVAVVIAPPGVTGTTATATATVVNGKIAAITINNSGSNYTTVPTVTIVNLVEKIQAVATAIVNANGTITGFTMNNVGEGYLTVPTVTITPSLTGVGTGATAIANLNTSTVSSLSVIYGGTGYTGINTPSAVQNAPPSTSASVKGTGTTIVYINLGTGKRTIEN